MREAEVTVIDESFCQTDNGLVTAIIFVDFGDFQFPERDWNDSVVVILSWWLDALVPFLRGSKSEIELGFMDGPLRLSVRKESDDICLVRCLEGEDSRVKYTRSISTLALLKSAIGAATRTQRICHQKSWYSQDLEALTGLVNTARKITHEH
jgi:hypothetical protein